MLKLETGRKRVPGGVEQLRVLLAAALGPVLSGYVAIAAVIATIAALATQARFSPLGILLAAGPGWLAAYQVPISIDGERLGLLPLAATLGVGVLVARSAAAAAERLGYRTPQQAVVVIATMATAHAVIGVTIALLANGTEVAADPLTAFGAPALLAAVAAALGLLRSCGLLHALRPYLDDSAVVGMRAAALGLAGLLAAGSVVLTLASALAAPTMPALFAAHAPGFGSGFGMLLLCIAYLPNAMLACLSFVVGPGFSFGAVSLSPLGFEGGSVPAVPLLAGLPDGYAGWWPLVFVLPAAVGAMVGWRVRTSSPAPWQRLRSVAVAGALIGFATVLLGTVAGGQLGTGRFTGVLLPVGLISVAAFCWIVIPGGLVAWFAGERPVRQMDGEDAADAVDATDVDEDAEGVDEDAAEDAAEAEVEDVEDIEHAEDVNEDDDDPDDDDPDYDAEQPEAEEESAETDEAPETSEEPAKESAEEPGEDER